MRKHAHTHTPNPFCRTRAALDCARQGHLLAFRAAIQAGTPVAELLQDLRAFGRAAGQLLRIFAQSDAGAGRRGAP